MSTKRIDDEILEHIEEKTLELIEAGVPEDDARRRARLEFGNAALVAESSREVWRWAWLDHVGQDLRYAWRQMRRHPGFTLVAVLSLALGIGANIAVFSVVDALLLRTLPVHEPDRLVSLDLPFLQGRTDRFPYPWVLSLQKATTLGHVSAIATLDRFNVATGVAGGALVDWPDRTKVELVSGDYFATIGIGATAGRTLSVDDDRAPGGHPVVVVSDRFRRRRFGFNDEPIGARLKLNAVTYTIVGVTPPGFDGDGVGDPTDLWIPIAMQSEVMTERPGLLDNHNAPWVRVLARLAPNASCDQAAAEVAGLIFEALKGIQPDLTLADYAPPGVWPASRGTSYQRQALREPLQALQVIVALLWLIACANVANLVLARSAVRQREMAVRMSLGAGRARIARQVLTENVCLALLASASAVAVGAWGAAALANVLGSGRAPLQLDLGLSLRLIGFAVAMSVATAAIFALAPALRAAGVNPSPALKTGSTGAGSPGGLRLSGLLIAGQVATVLVLLVGAGLFVQTLRNLRAQDLGFDATNVWTVHLAPSDIGRQPASIADEFRSVQERLAAIPGVRSVGASSSGLIGRSGASRLNIAGYTPRPDEDMLIDYNLVAADFFATAGVRFLVGHGFTARDDEHAAGVAVVNETFARRFFGRADIVGKTFSVGRDATGTAVEIVGVVKDAKYESLRDEGISLYYRPYRQDLNRLRGMNITVRAEAGVPGLAARIRESIHTFDPALPILDIEAAADAIDRTLVEERLTAGLSAGFGVIGVLLASIGLYGVVSHAVARRTNEIGVRMALGAGRARVSWMVVSRTLIPVLIGLGVGVPAALGASRGIAELLYGIQPTDVATIGGACVLLTIVAVAAAWAPATRASRVDPIVALRQE